MFELSAPFQPAGDQPEAIARLTEGVLSGARQQTLVGVTGSGKTFTIANVIQAAQKPTLVISHNKTLAAQLYAEFKGFFPGNAVEYFVSYFDYYQPEAYIPRTDTFIEKDSSINEEIERSAPLHHELGADAPRCHRGRAASLAFTASAARRITRRSSCKSAPGWKCPATFLLCRLVDLQYSRNDVAFERGQFRVRGDVVELRPAGTEDGLRVEFFGEAIERISRFDPLTGETSETPPAVIIFPAKQFVTPNDKIKRALLAIREEMGERIAWFEARGKLLEAQRIKMRTEYDLEMMEEMGFCSGIENYSRHLGGRPPGSRPGTLMDFFPKDYLLVVDESHATIPQIGGMHAGRPFPQNRPGRARLPPAQRPGQPAAGVLRISIPAGPDHLPQRHARRAGTRRGPRAASSSKSSAPPA